MILSHYAFADGLAVPQSFTYKKTSDLLSEGLVVMMSYPGLPMYTPIGTYILTQIESQLKLRFAQAGFELIRLPHIIRTTDLEHGEQIGEKFASKFMHLTDRMKEYHLLSTPEMLLLRTFQQKPLSHTHLPIRHAYCTDFFRQMPNPKSILIGRQFRIFGALSIELDEHGLVDALSIIRQLTIEDIENRGLPYRCIDSNNSSRLGWEIFYPCDEGDYRLEYGDEFDNEKRFKAPSDFRALSLGMAYQYGRTVRLPIRYRTAKNKNKRPLVATYGLCTNRLLFSVFDHARDEQGFNLPENLRPFDISILPLTVQEMEVANSLVNSFRLRKLRVALDDRFKRTREERFAFAAYVGTPIAILIDKEGIKLRLRNSSTATRLNSIEDAIKMALAL